MADRIRELAIELVLVWIHPECHTDLVCADDDLAGPLKALADEVNRVRKEETQDGTST